MSLERNTPVSKGIKAFAIGALILPGTLLLGLICATIFAGPEAVRIITIEKLFFASQVTMKTFFVYSWPVMLLLGTVLGLSVYVSEYVNARYGERES